MFLFKKQIRCPYCQKALEKKPSRKTKCPHCEKPIYVRDGNLLTEEEKVKHDDLEMFRFTEDEYKMKQSGLLKKWGFIPSHSDTIWALANEKILEYLDKKARYELTNLYLATAKYLHRGGKDFIELFKESMKCYLLEYKKMDVEKVEIITCGVASSSCSIYSGKILPLNEAIITMPIPNGDCLNKNRKEFHICMYRPAPYEFKKIENIF